MASCRETGGAAPGGIASHLTLEERSRFPFPHSWWLLCAFPWDARAFPRSPKALVTLACDGFGNKPHVVDTSSVCKHFNNFNDYQLQTSEFLKNFIGRVKQSTIYKMSSQTPHSLLYIFSLCAKPNFHCCDNKVRYYLMQRKLG